MTDSSLFRFIISRAGTYLGLLILILSTLFFLQDNNRTTDQELISILENCKSILAMAERSSSQFLSSGASQDLDEYNKQISLLNINTRQLLHKIKSHQKFQPAVVELQQNLKGHFAGINDKLVQKQSGRYSPDRQPSSTEDKTFEAINSIISEIQKNTTESWSLGEITLPVNQWKFLFWLSTAGFLFLMTQIYLKNETQTQKKNISELQIKSILLDGILNSMSEALIVIDENGHFTRSNIAAQRIIGSQIKSVTTDDDARELGLHPDLNLPSLPLSDLPFARTLRGEQLDDVEYVIKNSLHREGLTISLSSRYLNDIDGSIRGALFVFRDVTKRKATELEWHRAREAAIEASRKKSDFLAAMSHEIRTPMNGVIGMTTLLSDTKLDGEQKEYVGTIKRSAEALLMLINDILDHSKIEAGKIQLNPRPFDLHFLANDINELFLPAVREKNIQLDLQLVGDSTWKFIGDETRLRQILVNLVGNAVKFTEKGSVKIKIQSTAKSEAIEHLQFSVEDTGPGLEAEERASLFQKYFQAKAGIKYGGTGLGLSICRQLVDLMQGQIGLDSEVGVGSRFWFHLDLPVAYHYEAKNNSEVLFAEIFKGHVLIAEDQMVNQRVATTYMRKLGLKVDTAINGKVAVEKALENKYDVIFMDCQMPVLTGYEATYELRRQLNYHVPIVALTAEGTSGERAACLTARMDDFLTKPLELNRLIECLQKWLPSKEENFDWSALDKLREYMVGDKNLIESLITDFKESAPQLMASLHLALQTQATLEAQQAAHALKSSAATMGAKALADLCEKIEDCDNIQTMTDYIAQIDSELKLTFAALEKHPALQNSTLKSAA